MSLLISDSLVGLLDEESLDESSSRILGKIKIGQKSFDIDSFLTDGKTIRVHAIGEIDDAIDLISSISGPKSSISLGDNDFAASGEIKQIGWERLPHGNRIVISMSVRDK